MENHFPRHHPLLNFASEKSTTSPAVWPPPSTAPATGFSPSSTKTATGAANSKPTPPSNPTTSCSTSCSAPAIRSVSRSARNYILRHQNEDGGWPIFNGGPSNISASVKAYFGLKLAGYKPDHPALERARKKILELGGVTKVNTFTKIYLCFLGQYDYDAVPAIPPGDRAFPQLVLVQHLRNFVVVARHPRPALHRVREEAVQENSRRNGH